MRIETFYNENKDRFYQEDSVHLRLIQVSRAPEDTDDTLRANVATALGVIDTVPVQREVFRQWVVADDLGPDAADLASVGVVLSNDVHGFDQAKLGQLLA